MPYRVLRLSILPSVACGLVYVLPKARRTIVVRLLNKFVADFVVHVIDKFLDVLFVLFGTDHQNIIRIDHNIVFKSFDDDQFVVFPLHNATFRVIEHAGLAFDISFGIFGRVLVE